MDRNLFNHCMVCGKRNDDTSHNQAGFHVHDACYDKVAHLDMAQYTSATVITHRDRTIDDRWYVITDEHLADGWCTIKVYPSTQDYLDHNPSDTVDRAFYVSAVAYVVNEMNKEE